MEPKLCSVLLKVLFIYQYLCFLPVCNKMKWSEVKVTQSCPTLRDPMERSLPGSSIHEISQARILEWVTISFSRGRLCDPGIESTSPAWQADSLPPKPYKCYSTMLSSWSIFTACLFYFINNSLYYRRGNNIESIFPLRNNDYYWVLHLRKKIIWFLKMLHKVHDTNTVAAVEN